MSRFQVVDQDNFEPGKGLEMDPVDIVDRDGYRTTEEMVEEMLTAGENLMRWRKEQKEAEYDQPYDDTDIDLPPERRQGFDTAEAHQELMRSKVELGRWVEEDANAQNAAKAKPADPVVVPNEPPKA